MFDAAPPVAVSVPAPVADFSIARLPDRPSLSTIRRPCAAGAPDEVVVCGRRDDSRYRLGPLPPSGLAAPGEPGLGFDLAPDLRVSQDVEQVDLGSGFVAQRVWVRLRFRF